MSEASKQVQPIDTLMTQMGISNGDLVAASTEQLTFKNVQKARTGRRLTIHIQDKILSALLKMKPELKLARRDLFRYDVDPQVVEAIHEAGKLGAARKINYPQLVDRYLKAGITRYEVEVATHRITYFATAGEAHLEQGPVPQVDVPGAYRMDHLRSAISDAQKGLIDYLTFLRRIYEAGIVRYEANLRSREIRYMGEKQIYKEHIPEAAPEDTTIFPSTVAPKVAVPVAAKPKAKKPAKRRVAVSLKARKNAKKSWNKRRR